MVGSRSSLGLMSINRQGARSGGVDHQIEVIVTFPSTFGEMAQL